MGSLQDSARAGPTSLLNPGLPMLHPHRVTRAVPRRTYPSAATYGYVGGGSKTAGGGPPRADRAPVCRSHGHGPRAPASAGGVARGVANGEGDGGATAAPDGHVQRTSSARDDRRLGAAGVVVFGAVAAFGSQTNNDLSLPGTGSQSAKDLLQEKFPPQQNGANPIVFDVSKGKLTDQANKQAINASVKAIKQQPHVYSVTNPLSSSGQTAGLLSKDKQTAFAPVLMDVSSGDLTTELAQNVMDATAPATKAGITTAAAGSIGTTLSDESSETSEIVGIVAAMIILSFVLGSLVAMGLPIITAVPGSGSPCR